MSCPEFVQDATANLSLWKGNTLGFIVNTGNGASVPFEDPSVLGKDTVLPLEGVTKLALVSPVSALYETVGNQVVDNMNRRTAEQGTAECRSEKHCLIP